LFEFANFKTALSSTGVIHHNLLQHLQKLASFRPTDQLELILTPHSPDVGLNFPDARTDSDIGVSILSWIERGGHGAPDG
jgi:hypothetical protein